MFGQTAFVAASRLLPAAPAGPFRSDRDGQRLGRTVSLRP